MTLWMVGDVSTYKILLKGEEEGAQKEPAQGELLSTDMTIDQHADEEL